MTPETLKISPLLEAFLQSDEGKRSLHIIGPEIETPPQVTILEVDEKARYYSLEVKGATGSKNMTDVVLTPEGNWQDLRRKSYVNNKLVTIVARFKELHDTRKFIETRDPSLESYDVPTTEFFLGGFFAQYGPRKGINIMAIGCDEGDNRVWWKRGTSGNWTSSVIGHQIAMNRTKVQLKIPGSSIKGGSTLSAPLRINSKSWFQKMGLPDRSWRNLAREFPINLQITTPLK